MEARKIRVLHLELDEHLGGIESFLYNLYSEIDRNKVQFDFISRYDNPAMGSELRKLGSKISKVSSYRKPLKYMSDLDHVIRTGGYDVVHIHKNSAAVILPFLVTRKYKKIRVFVHSHNTKPSIGGISTILHLVNRIFLWENASSHFACSETAGRWLYGNGRNFIVVKNGIATEKYVFSEEQRVKKRRELNISKDAFVIGNVGRFSDQKNQKRLIGIFEEFQKQDSTAVLLLVGEGKLKQEIEDYSKKRQINNIHFLGIRKDIPELMMAMDAFVMPSLYEGLPIVAIEAQAAGLDLYLSEAISHEAEISSSVSWFSLNETNQNIAENIKRENVNGNVRKMRNIEVKNQEYDMKHTANVILESYI